MSQGSLNPKIRFLDQKMCSLARGQTDGQTDTKVTTEGTLSGFQEFFLQPIIKDRPNIMNYLTTEEQKMKQKPKPIMSASVIAKEELTTVH